MKNILCYGDSNTFGANPKGGRHPKDTRWTGRLQQLLGTDYNIIEEGMCGRTTVWTDPLEPGRNGLEYLPIALESHKPLDLIIFSLGTNDCKTYFRTSPKVIGRGIEFLCTEALRYAYGVGFSAPKILIISPILIRSDKPQNLFLSFDHTSAEKSNELSTCYRQVAQAHEFAFFDAALVAEASEHDQLHMDAENHLKLAEALFQFIPTLL